MRERYYELWNDLTSIENLFNESDGYGISASLDKFFGYWEDLSLRPNDYASREALLTHTQSFVSLLQNTDSNLRNMQQQAEEAIVNEVDEVNGLLESIAAVNKQISLHNITGSNNANQLLDKRDSYIRELATKIDVRVLDTGGINATSSSSEWSLVTTSGKTLVQGGEFFRLAYEGPQSVADLTTTSTFDGDIKFDGESDFEYTVEVVQGGDVASDSSAAMFRVSIDGGQTWLKDEHGNEEHFFARPDGLAVNVRGVDIWFENATQPLDAGDTFTIVPKNGLYWYQTASHKEIISPQIRGDGTDNPQRLVGGKLAALMIFSSQKVGEYREKLDSTAETLIWEVNRLHSQGAGLTMASDILGTYSVADSSLALGSDSSGLAWNTRLQSGNLMVYAFEEGQNETLSAASFGPLDFDPATPGIQNFDPTQHSLEDVRDAFNNTFGTFLSASIVNNALRINAKAGYDVGFGSDSTGLLAGLGINTYFSGSSVTDIGLNPEVHYDNNRINAGHINGSGEFNPGDNGTALDIGDLRDKKVSIVSLFSSNSNQTIMEYYSTLVADVGGDTANAEFTYQYTNALADDLNEQQQAISGVNLDEEMTSLIKYQSSYRAAAKLITTADEMLQIVLGLKQ